jgi:hypothetical protein
MLDMRFSTYIRPAPGKSYVYHLGLLGADRQIPGPGRASADKSAEAAWQDYESGYVTLTQRKLSDGIYEYIAVGLEK